MDSAPEHTKFVSRGRLNGVLRQHPVGGGGPAEGTGTQPGREQSGLDELDTQAYRAVSHLTVGQFREWLLDIETTGMTLRAVAPGLTPEMAAAACK